MQGDSWQGAGGAALQVANPPHEPPLSCPAAAVPGRATPLCCFHPPCRLQAELGIGWTCSLAALFRRYAGTQAADPTSQG